MVDNKIYLIKDGCQSKLLKVKTAWAPNSSSLSFRFPVFRLSTHNEGPFEITCTIDINQGIHRLKFKILIFNIKKIVIKLKFSKICFSDKSYPASSCPNNGEYKHYEFELPDINSKVLWSI